MRSQRRPLLGAVVAFALALGGCSGGTDAVLDATTTAQLPSQTTSAPQADEILRSALARYDAGYEFGSRVVVNGEAALDVDGRHVSGGSQMTIRSGEGEVEYLISGGSQWARTPGGAWDVLSEGEASPPPLEPLKSPTAVEGVTSSDSVVALTARYPAAAFDLVGPDLEVTLIVEDGLLVSASYVTTDGDSVATVETIFAPLTDFSPITTP